MSSSSAAEVDRTIRCLMDEVRAMEENAMHPPPAKKKKPEGWTVKKGTPNDSPSASWTDDRVQYTVQNPENCGNVLLKMSVFQGGRATHSCGLYLDEVRDGEIYVSLIDLLVRIENMWVDRNTGVPKFEGVSRTAIPLPAWRKPRPETPRDCATAGGKSQKADRSNKRKKT